MPLNSGMKTNLYAIATGPMTASKSPIVLIVEDNKPFSAALREFLKLRFPQFEVHAATTGACALKKFARLQPQLVLMDIQLPDINGLEITRRFKAQSPDTLVIVMSMLTGASIAEKAQANGAAFISKDHLFRDLQPLLAHIYGSSEKPTFTNQ